MAVIEPLKIASPSGFKWNPDELISIFAPEPLMNDSLPTKKALAETLNCSLSNKNLALLPEPPACNSPSYKFKIVPSVADELSDLIIPA